jgi:hypothetical protein
MRLPQLGQATYPLSRNEGEAIPMSDFCELVFARSEFDMLSDALSIGRKRRQNVGGAALALLMLAAACTPLRAQELGRPQDGFYSGQSNSQYSGQYSGQINSRVDGRGGHNQGLPPSAADRGNRFFDNPIQQSDCREVDAFTPDARPGWQARVRVACQ